MTQQFMQGSTRQWSKFVGIKRFKRRWMLGVLAALATFLFSAWLSIGGLLENQSFATVVYDSNEHLLAARLSQDGQWRFPAAENIPDQYIQCLITFEDKRFYYHPGIDPLALSRAIITNLRKGRVVSGGSTITMQLARLLRRKSDRNFIDKLSECFYAIGLELRYSKKEILLLYASFAPFGGNVVGMDAALWRYFGRSERTLSWAESALLAVLPNQPSWMHLERNRPLLLSKRNALLYSLLALQKIDSLSFELAVDEPLPDQLHPIPTAGIHLMEYLRRTHPNQSKFLTTLDFAMQDQLNEIVKTYSVNFRGNEIHNCAILIVDNKRSNVMAYIANTTGIGVPVNNAHVDNIQSLRSSGSILKPLLYGMAWEKGILHPGLILQDIPTMFGNFNPQNYSRTFEGISNAHSALQRSLNIPAVRLLQQFGPQQFYDGLNQIGFTSFTKPVEHYGLSLILGGGEVSVWELATVYSGLVFELTQYFTEPDQRRWKKLKNLKLLKSDSLEFLQPYQRKGMSVPAIYTMLEMMHGVPEGTGEWDHNSQKMAARISWKTGTSFGFKDAWCIGISPEYTIVTWIGNSNGIGRPGLIGLNTAAPLLFELASSLGMKAEWKKPFDLMRPVEVCSRSGNLPSPNCLIKDTAWLTAKESSIPMCPYHQQIYVDQSQQYRVHASCDEHPIPKIYFVLSPMTEYFFKLKHGGYETLPPWKPKCLEQRIQPSHDVEIIFPLPGSEVFIPKDLDTLKNNIIFKATHRLNAQQLFWFLDGYYLGSTRMIHEWQTPLKAGLHHLTVVDEAGQRSSVMFKSSQRSESH